MASASHTTLDVFLDFVKRAGGFDFTGYKRSSIERRVVKRMAEVGVERYEDYLDYLELHADEFAELFNTILINVTGLLPRPADVGVPRRRRCSRTDRIASAGRAAAGLVRRLRVGRGGIHDGDGARAGARRRGVPRAGEDLRHRRRRGGARPAARTARICRASVEDVPRDALERFFERTDQRLRVPQGPAPLRDLRPQRPRPGRADLAHRPARLPQHAHVLHRRDAGADPRAASTSR